MTSHAFTAGFVFGLALATMAGLALVIAFRRWRK